MTLGSVRRGDIIRVNFDETGGRAMQKTRPALILQNDVGNKHSPYTIVAAIHHDTKKGLPVHVAIPRGVSGLVKNSLVDCGILMTVSQSDLGETIGHLPPSYMHLVDEALRISVGLR